MEIKKFLFPWEIIYSEAISQNLKYLRELFDQELLCIFIILLWLGINNDYFKRILKNSFSIFLFLIFASIPFDKLKFNIFTLIKQISRYTGGIYYIHLLIYSLLKQYISFIISSGNIFMCIILYFLCYFICFIGSKLCKHNILKYLFI